MPTYTVVSTGGSTSGSTGWTNAYKAYDADTTSYASSAIALGGADTVLRYNFPSPQKVHKVYLFTGITADVGLTVKIYIGSQYTGATNDIVLNNNANTTIAREITGTFEAASYCDLVLHRTDTSYPSSLLLYLKHVELQKALDPGSFALSSPSNNTTLSIGSPTFTWGVSAYADSYTLVVDDHSDFSSPSYNAAVGNVTSKQITLTNGTYYWKVTATNTVGASTNASNNPYKLTISVQLPGSFNLIGPADLITGIATNPTISWDASSSAESYIVQVDDHSDFSSPIINQNVGNVTSYQISGLANSTTYYWKVTATNSAGSTASNSTFQFTTTNGLPQVETRITGGNTTGSTAINPGYAFDGLSTYASMDYLYGYRDIYYNFTIPHKITKIVFKLAYCNGSSGDAVFVTFYLGTQSIGSYSYGYGESGTYTYYPDMSSKNAAGYFRATVTGDIGTSPWIDITEIELYDMMDQEASSGDDDAFWF